MLMTIVCMTGQRIEDAYVPPFAALRGTHLKGRRPTIRRERY
jgi:hypothetical protein